jgi:hypothetical protein
MSKKTEELLKLIEDTRKRMQDECKGKFLEIFKEFFAANPEIKTIYFTGYTPYFNDGDECVYGVSSVCFTSAEWTDVKEDIHYMDEEERKKHPVTYTVSGYSLLRDDKDIPEDMETLGKFLMNDEFTPYLKEIVGDHMFVRVHRGGVETVEYEHDH